MELGIDGFLEKSTFEATCSKLGLDSCVDSGLRQSGPHVDLNSGLIN
jgi:hypothetical protein